MQKGVGRENAQFSLEFLLKENMNNEQETKEKTLTVCKNYLKITNQQRDTILADQEHNLELS